MPERRAPRWVFWPAKLLWFPLLAIGLPLMAHQRVDVDDIGAGWRVVTTITTPDQWVAHPETFWPGLAMTILGVVALMFYTNQIEPGRFTAIEYPIFTIASWCFALLALLSLFSTSAHVADVGSRGLDWRFLAAVRTTPIDLIVVGLSSAAWLGTWLASWGFVSGRWATPADAEQHQSDA